MPKSTRVRSDTQTEGLRPRATPTLEIVLTARRSFADECAVECRSEERMDRDPHALGRKSQEKDTVIGNGQCEQHREISRDAMRSSPETPRGGPVEQRKHSCGTDD